MQPTVHPGIALLCFGSFLIVCGLLGYLSNPAAAKTALISGGSFGSLSILWGIWFLRGGRRAAWMAATGTTVLLLAAFSWRSVVTWMAVSEGEPKRFAAVLITSMLLASVLMLTVLLRKRA
ncbi:MAG: hypothetical protein ABQ298_14590 [Puniceicoccaceae bacterium]